MTSIKSKIQPLSDTEILTYWKAHLWRDRKDPIKAMSSMLINGDYDMQIYIFHKPRHVGIFVDNELVGCNSSHVTSDNDMRSRGLFVDERFRGQGFSQMLLNEAEAHARKEKCRRVWSYPRLSALPVYEKFGFSIYVDPAPVQSADDSHAYVAKDVIY